MSISSNDVTLQLMNSIDHRGEYKAFRAVTANIQVRAKTVGSISAVIIDRKKIPEDLFLSAMDGHSGEMQLIAVSLFEPHWARTKVQSLKDAGDEEKFPVMYIESMHVDDEFKEGGQNSDVATYALHQLLHDPYVQKRKVSSCMYILDPTEAMTRQEKEQNESNRRWRGDDEPETEESTRIEEEEEQRMNQYARLDANPYLRNGFYQDEAVARLPDNAARILIAAQVHWNQPLKSQSDVAGIQLYVKPRLPKAVGRDAEILELTMKICEDCSGEMQTSSSSTTEGFTLDLYKLITKSKNVGRTSAYKTAVSLHIQKGGSLVRSHALHAACANNDSSVVQCILQMDPLTISARDDSNSTPLMVAATAAAGRCTSAGLSTNQPVIDILLASGADKNEIDSKGLTAYGLFLLWRNDYNKMIQAICGRPTQSSNSRELPGFAELQAKLMPQGGPTRADQMGGGDIPGFVYYGEDKKRRRG